MWDIFLINLTNNWWLYLIFVVLLCILIYVLTYNEKKSRRTLLSKEIKEDVDEVGKLAGIVSGLGGVENIYDFDNCTTRLRVTVNDGRLVDRGLLRSTGAMGILGKDRGVQIIYGADAGKIKKELEVYVDKIKETDDDSADEIFVCDERIIERIYTPVEGDIIYLADIHSYEALGNENRDGIAISPKRGEIRAPFDGEVRSVEKGRGELVICSKKGVSLRIHVGTGLDEPYEEGFYVHTRQGAACRKGSLLAEFDIDMLESRGYDTTTYVVLAGLDEHYGYKAYIRENVNFEHVAIIVFDDSKEKKQDS